LAALPGAAALIASDPPASEARTIVKSLAAPQNTVRWIHFVSAGQEGFAAAGMPPGIIVTHPAGAISPTVAEHAIALLLALGRRIPEIAAATGRHAWDRSMAQTVTTLEGAVLAIVGFGSIAQEIARRARGFGASIVAVARTPKPSDLADEILPLSALHAVLGRADAIAVAIALAPETHHLMGPAAFAACKKGALFVNIARGGIVDQAALGEALRSGRIGGAGLDVTEPEPLPSDDPLWSCPNLLISGHFSGSGSLLSQRRLAEGAGDNLERFVAGRDLAHRLTL
ncbi:MAG: D-isomer specific 2-hydroxyacid dehydrogenase NAD-binding, partial [Rhodospirillales bacterium]|nr:D-isomer specific 2-hydroxyacid dehydrogenase NAD-binding [Rhodospirillales bacterium]